MIPNPIHKVLSTLSSHEVRHLLMGGQACVFYGAAEFSRDCDIVIVADSENLARLQSALNALQATRIAVPPFEKHYLDRGHAVHFRCQHPEALGIRLDVMSKMRGCDSFEQLWERRLTLEDAAGNIYQLLGIEDLVAAKKTQRDKDWPMIRRLLDAHHDEFHESPNDDQVRFWLRESRTPAVLIEMAKRFPQHFAEELKSRPLLKFAQLADQSKLQQELDEEQAGIREADRLYWRPLIQELGQLRAAQRSSSSNDSD